MTESCWRARQTPGRCLDRDVAGLQDRAAGFGHGGQQRVVFGRPQ
jgi:hypothetical protein